ncbi:nitroreductase family protein [Planctomicrobium sp. SH664]|uniref:nitroreductase family protein n=1 Tax=Planctomicrobium sp. SH664 TaxID=3448125 RepID=UPI003F5B971C
MGAYPDAGPARQPDYEIHDLILKRWSPRALSGEKISEKQLLQLFEAARWAPSSYNEQEWRFLYAHRDTPHWKVFFDLLVEGNQLWCRNAGVLVVVLSKKTFARNGKPNRNHSMDSGLAVQNLMLQAAALDLVTHGMSGFDPEKARVDLKVPEDFQVECMMAIGVPGKVEDLPPELQSREAPSSRKAIQEFAREGEFSF